MIIGNKEFDLTNRTYVMGILNVTPDSFSDGGCWNNLDKALAHAEKMKEEGAAIIDVGGESTRPGYTQISDEEEIERVVPVIEALKKEIDLPISIDTYKSTVADAALSAGADLVNDIWGFLYDEKIAAVTAKYDAACCLSHNREIPVYENLVPDVIGDLTKSAQIALQADVRKDAIILDPGVGFAKSYEENLTILKHLDEFTRLEYPILLGTSRKSVIGLKLDLPKDQREEGTLVTTVLAAQAHCGFVRVHDVEKNVRAIKMMEAINGVR